MADILRWHGAEELEHKCVAFDVMHEVTGGSYGWRLAGYLMASFQMARLWPICTDHLIDRDPALQDLAPKERRREIWRSFRRRNLPGRELIGPLFQYFKPGFHPSHHETLEMARRFLVTSPAVRAIPTRDAAPRDEQVAS
jgi:predicted metal-dependent hydrolase